jgi:hypothetical protein
LFPKGGMEAEERNLIAGKRANIWDTS